MLAMTTIPALQSLRGRHVTFTGRLDDMTRAEASQRTRRQGGVVVARVTSTTDVLVQGAPSPAHKWGDIGVKLAEVDRLRDDRDPPVRRGRHGAMARALRYRSPRTSRGSRSCRTTTRP